MVSEKRLETAGEGERAEGKGGVRDKKEGVGEGGRQR